MYDNTCLRIVEQVNIKPGIHKRELSKQLKLSMPSIDYALKKLDKLMRKQRSGNQIKYFLDYSKEALTPILCAAEYSKFEKLPASIRITIEDFLKEVKEKPIISVIFGSYAKGNYIKDSDIDILLVYQIIGDAKNIESTAKKVSMRIGMKISPIYLDYDSFRKSFHDPTKEFFKNIKKDKIVLTGIEWWRQLKDEEA